MAADVLPKHLTVCLGECALDKVGVHGELCVHQFGTLALEVGGLIRTSCRGQKEAVTNDDDP